MPPAYFGQKKKKKKQNWGSGSTPLELCKKDCIPSCKRKPGRVPEPHPPTYLPCRRRAGLEPPLCCPTLHVLQLWPRAARSWREIPRAGTPRDPATRRRRANGARSGATRRCAGLQRHWLAAALKRARGSAPPGPLLNVKPRKPQRMEMAHQSSVSQALVLRGE